MRNPFHVAIALAGLLVLAGCASPYTVRTQAFLFAENPVTRVAVVAEGTMFWHGVTRDVYDPAEARPSLDLLTREAEQYLTASGYEVVFSSPLRVTGSRNPKGYQLCENYDNRHERVCSTMSSGAPSYAWPSDEDVAQPAARLLDAIGNTPFADLQSHVPEPEDVAALAEATGADTVCLLRFRDVRPTLWAGSYWRTGGRYLPDFQDYVLTDDHPGLILICADALGRVLWQEAVFQPDLPPEERPRETIARSLRHFPKAGHPLTAACMPRGDGDGDLWLCKKPPIFFEGEGTVLYILALGASLL